MDGLNESQQRHLLASFGEVDRLLREIERVARADLTPFAKQRADLSPDESRLVLSFVGSARGRMLAALDHLGIPRPTAAVSGRWSIETALNFAQIALAGLRPESLAGYGSVDATAAREVRALEADLRSVIRRGIALLHEQDPGGLGDKVSKLPGRVGAVLRALERLSAEHGLAEVRPLIAATLERAMATTLDIGVFGRVGAGKSSLINALVGTPAMPVGATPVTAVPVRIQRGSAGATVHLYEGGARAIPLQDIVTYVTEEHNPQNRLGVRSVDVMVPSAPEGVRLVDTPGVGSLASSGPAQAFAWLPRCDLGLVLIQAGTPVGREELALVTGLLHAGIGYRLLVSKADLLGAADAERAAAYVSREFAGVHAGAGSIEVRLVSTRSGHSEELEAFRRDVLEPLVLDRTRAAEEALRARLHRLVAIAAAELAGRRGGADERVRSLARARVGGTGEIERETDWLGQAGPHILSQATGAVVDAWSRGEHGATATRKVILDSAADALAAVQAAVESARVGAPARPGDETRRFPPLFDPELLDRLPALAPPRVGRRLFGPAVAARALRPVAGPLTEALERYAERLRAWGLRQLDEQTSEAWEPVGAPAPLTGELATLDALIDRGEGVP